MKNTPKNSGNTEPNNLAINPIAPPVQDEPKSVGPEKPTVLDEKTQEKPAMPQTEIKAQTPASTNIPNNEGKPENSIPVSIKPVSQVRDEIKYVGTGKLKDVVEENEKEPLKTQADIKPQSQAATNTE